MKRRMNSILLSAKFWAKTTLQKKQNTYKAGSRFKKKEISKARLMQISKLQKIRVMDLRLRFKHKEMMVQSRFFGFD